MAFESKPLACALNGGDEFVLLCRSCDEASVRNIIANISKRLTELAAENALPYAISLSCGYACWDSSAQSLSDLVIAADQELYQRKAEKKQRSSHQIIEKAPT